MLCVGGAGSLESVIVNVTMDIGVNFDVYYSEVEMNCWLEHKCSEVYVLCVGGTGSRNCPAHVLVILNFFFRSLLRGCSEGGALVRFPNSGEADWWIRFIYGCTESVHGNWTIQLTHQYSNLTGSSIFLKHIKKKLQNSGNMLQREVTKF